MRDNKYTLYKPKSHPQGIVTMLGLNGGEVPAAAIVGILNRQDETIEQQSKHIESLKEQLMQSNDKGATGYVIQERDTLKQKCRDQAKEIERLKGCINQFIEVCEYHNNENNNGVAYIQIIYGKELTQ